MSSDPPPIELARLHPTSLLFDVISHGRSYLIPAVIALFSAAKGNMGGVIIAGLIFFPAILTSIFHYFTFRYSIRNRQLVVTKGLIFRRVRTVPVSRIQNVDSVQNILHRLFGVAEVRVETASGTEPEATLRVLSLQQMEALRAEIFDLKKVEDLPVGNVGTEIPSSFSIVSDSNGVTEYKTVLAEGIESAQPHSVPSPTYIQKNRLAAVEASNDLGQTLLRIPVTWLIRAGLASNRGLIMIGVLIGLFYQFDLEKQIDFRQIEKFIPQHADWLTLALLIFAGSIAGLGLLRILGVSWYILRFFDYLLVRRGDDLRISCGLLTKVSATVPRGRIQFISIHRNLIMRWMGYASVRIETAGGAGKNHEDAATTVSRRWFVPIIPNSELPRLLGELRPGFEWDESRLDFQPLSPKAGRRLVRLAIILSFVLAIVGFGITRPWGWLAGVLAGPILVAWAIKKSRSMRYARTCDGVVYRSGVLNRKTSLTFFDRIQTVRVDQSPFDRRWKMAQLSIDTAAAGPAEHRIDIPLLDEEFAWAELARLQMNAARAELVFR